MALSDVSEHEDSCSQMLMMARTLRQGSYLIVRRVCSSDMDVALLHSDFKNKYARPAVRIAQKYFEWTWSTPPLDIILERSPRGTYVKLSNESF